MRASRSSLLAVCLLVLQACSGDVSAQAPSGPREKSSEPVGAEGARTTGQASNRVLVRGTSLELQDCKLSYVAGPNSGAIPLLLSAPCQFASDATGSVRVVESAGVLVLIVESSQRSPPLVPGGANVDCDTRLRGVVVTPTGVHLSPGTQLVATCAPALWDEKMFHVFALDAMEASKR